MPCTTILAGKKATADDSTLVARNEDYGHALNPKCFIVVTPDKQPQSYQSVTSKCKVDLPNNPMRYTAVPELESTMKKVGWWGEAGINAASIAMSATETSTTNSRVLGVDPMNKTGIGEEDFVTIVLPYIHSAREGVKLLGKYLEKYGTYEANGVAFSDKDEVWYMETIGGHHWAAKRVQDDCYVAAPNWFSITDFNFNSDDTIFSADLEKMIKDNYLDIDHQGNPYNLRHVFGSHDDSDYEYNIPRQWYIQKLLNPSEVQEPDNPDLPFAKRPEHLLTIEDFKYALSSHYQHTKYDPYGLEGTEANHHAFRPIGFQRNQELSILQIRNNVPAKIAGVQWLAFGPNAFNGIAPYYTNVFDTPSTYRDTKEHFDIQDMYWLTHAITTIADEHPFRYSASIEEMKQSTLAAGRHVLLETDQAVQDLDGEELPKKLQEANDKTAKVTYAAAMKCFGESNEAFAKYFIGKSYLKGLASSKEAKAAVSNVTFEPGCRNNWHEHTVPQILVAVAGEGWYQEEGKPSKKMLPDDVVIVDPNTKHWHGAAKDSWFAHLAIMVGDSKNTWYGPVIDEEYNKLS